MWSSGRLEMDKITMANDPQDLSQKLAHLQAKYIAQFESRFDNITAALELLQGQNSLEDKAEGLKTLEYLTHKLAGSGATYGFPEITLAAKKIERACLQIKKTGQTLSTKDYDQLVLLVQDLAEAKPEN
ncbi:MAG: hypothetical protein COB59_04475 [Rhodospirillaceae bacterium]|nr:MAG: hypothetical protein COB59_04475 [Rhodospirillaceae bacterium]